MTIERDIGRLEAEVRSLKADIASLEPKLDTAVDFITASKATRRTVIALSSIAGSVGASIFAAIAWALEHFKS